MVEMSVDVVYLYPAFLVAVGAVTQSPLQIHEVYLMTGVNESPSVDWQPRSAC